MINLSICSVDKKILKKLKRIDCGQVVKSKEEKIIMTFMLTESVFLLYNVLGYGLF